MAGERRIQQGRNSLGNYLRYRLPHARAAVCFATLHCPGIATLWEIGFEGFDWGSLGALQWARRGQLAATSVRFWPPLR